jgi:uncharacterized protein
VLYCDTSALLKLYIDEAGTAQMKALCASKPTIFVAEITWTEMRAALAQRIRLNLTPQSMADAALDRLRTEWVQFSKIPIGRELIEKAGDFAAGFGLRAYDSVQLAAGHEMQLALAGDVQWCCYDKQLNTAAQLLGMKIATV